MKQPAVYILASGRNGTLYTGVTSDLVGRTWQHKEHIVDGFAKKYGVTILVWYELHDTMDSAITREKRIKAWKREWKIRVVEEMNPYWNDLWPEIVGVSGAVGKKDAGSSIPGHRAWPDGAQRRASQWLANGGASPLPSQG